MLLFAASLEMEIDECGKENGDDHWSRMLLKHIHEGGRDGEVDCVEKRKILVGDPILHYLKSSVTIRTHAILFSKKVSLFDTYIKL